MSTSKTDIILKALDLSGWVALMEPSAQVLQRIMREAGNSAVITLNLTDETTIDLTNVVNQRAVDFAMARGAELVKDISDSTREMMRSTIEQALAEGWSAKQLGDAIEQGYAFSPQRAETIGRTEIARASERGTIDGWKASGVVNQVRVVLGSEHDIDDECNDAADAGAMPIDDAEIPPLHVNCICSLEAVLSDE
jgi:hypothetical protein